MKVLLACSDFFLYGSALLKAFLDLGVQVETYIFTDEARKKLIGKSHYKLCMIYNQLIGRNERLIKHLDSVRKHESEKFYREYCKFQPDLMVAFPGYTLNATILKEIQCSQVLWVYDSLENIPFMKDVLKYYDIIYTFERTDVESYRKLGIDAKFLPLCADASIYFPTSNEKKDIDVSFVWNLSKDRR